MFRLLVSVLAVSAIFPSFVFAEVPTSKEVLPLLRKAIETRDDVNTAVRGAFTRATTEEELAAAATKGGDLMYALEVNLERIEHLRTLALLHEVAKDQVGTRQVIEVAAITNAERIDHLVEGNLKVVSSVSEEAKDTAIVSVADDVRDRIRECRDLWAKCK